MSANAQDRQTDLLVIGVTGRIGAGKTSAAQYLSSRYGFQYIRYSQILATWLGGSESKNRLQEFGWEVMNGGRQDELNRRLIEQIAPDSNAVVDGLRHPIDYESLSKKFGFSFHLLYIDTAIDVRWARLKGHSRYQTRQDFDAADSHPVEQQIEKLRTDAEMVLRNDGSPAELHSALDTVIRDLRREGAK